MLQDGFQAPLVSYSHGTSVNALTQQSMVNVAQSC